VAKMLVYITTYRLSETQKSGFP